MIEIHRIIVTPIQQNARVLIDPDSQTAAVIDPGGAGADNDTIEKLVRSKGAKITQIWLTHSHLDHCGGVAELQRRTGAKLYASDNPGEVELRRMVPMIAQMYGMDGRVFEACPEPDHVIGKDGQVTLGGVAFKVLFTPGHSPGHLCFYQPEQGFVLCGDTIFAGSVGRTDLPGGDHETLINSIERELLTLPPQTRLMPGHGEDTSVERESRSNPFLINAGRS